MTGYRLGHGAAVAIGILLDTEYAVRLGRLPPAAADALHDGLAAAGFALWDAALARRLPDGRLEVLLGLAAFREHLGGALSITLPTAIGACADVAEMDDAQLTAAVASLHQRALARAS
jgi:3-dehydroquinate synthase